MSEAAATVHKSEEEGKETMACPSCKTKRPFTFAKVCCDHCKNEWQETFELVCVHCEEKHTHVAEDPHADWVVCTKCGWDWKNE